ncbi:MAG TPA: hypothetical protein VGW57_01595 [Chthoniobacterales bacterium]|nr:hypothetical protein [Chthoniobacterales bacterium]
MLPNPKRHLAVLCLAVLATANPVSSQTPPADNTPTPAATAKPTPTPSATSTPAPSATASPTPKATPPKQDLASITLLGANDNNDALSTSAPLGAPLPLILLVKEVPPGGHDRGELRVSLFSSQGEQPPGVAAAKIRTGESDPKTSSAASETATVQLDKKGEIAFSLEFDRLRSGKTYKGQLFLTSDGLHHHWDLTFTTGGRGTIAVEPVGTLKFVRLPLPFIPGTDTTGSFSLTLRDKSESGPYHHLGIRFEPSAAANTKALSSNFTLDALSFWDNDNKRVDLERRDPGTAVTLDKGRTFTARIGPLTPGEYSGTLRFTADEASDDAAEAKLPLLIQVRHHWSLPVGLILIGSIFGWFTSKYVVGARRARELSRQIAELRARADYLARRSVSRAKWEFPSEGGSLGFARLGVALNRLARMAGSTMVVILDEKEIEDQRQRAELRLGALESLQEVRLKVQPFADARPAAQLAIGRTLRQATDLLERPSFGELEKAALTKLLEQAEAWADPSKMNETYQKAVLDRRLGSECPNKPDIDAFAGGTTLRTQLTALYDALPREDQIKGQTQLADLKTSDEAMARIILLWRERNRPWAEDLAAAYASGKTAPQDLFNEVDRLVWNFLKKEATDKKFELRPASQENPQTYHVVEIDLESTNLESDRLRYHPLRVGWRVQPKGGDVRTPETDGLTLVQYFPSEGPVEVKASLRWKGDEISIENPVRLDVVPNPEYRKRGMFIMEWTEYAAIALAALFAMITAMGAQYDSTFGSFTQYVTMFIWAAGAGTGGNLFSQLGANSAPGGAASSITAAPPGK